MTLLWAPLVLCCAVCEGMCSLWFWRLRVVRMCEVSACLGDNVGLDNTITINGHMQHLPRLGYP
jgi:hypothetical protein